MDAVGEQEDKLRLIAERRIREAMETGEFNVQGGPDERLDLEENPYVPEDMRLAFKVLQNSHYRPDFVELADEIEQEIAALRLAADNHFRYLRERLDSLVGSPRGIRRMREEVAALKLRHARATAHHAQTIEEINHKIHRYNATVPAPNLMRGTLIAEDEMCRFADRLPAYLNY